MLCIGNFLITYQGVIKSVHTRACEYYAPERRFGACRVQGLCRKYRGTIIKGWMGRFVLNGNKKLLKLGYDCGIGAKNSQGFWMVELLNEGGGRENT